MFAGKSVLITGGTGSFGKAFLRSLLLQHPDVERIVIFSRDELKQYEMSLEFSPQDYPCLRYFIGDIRDKDRLFRALSGVDTVIHAAALKQVPAAEYNPFECIKTNVLGAQNLIEACLDTEVENVVALSTDKAAAPINLYGATKLCSDKLFISANNIRGKRDLKFSVVRYGNVMGSRGSVVPLFEKQKDLGCLTITDSKMTRFNISLGEGVEMVMWALKNALGGEIFVPKIPSYRITDIAEAVAPGAKVEVIGIRPGEKLHEEMITESDSLNTVDLGDYYAILPAGFGLALEDYCGKTGAVKVEQGFNYHSGNNTEFLDVEQLRVLINERENLN